MDKFDELTAFVKVVDSGSFTAAAERLGVAKSAVSRRVADLEARLGAQLIRRTTRRLSLTEMGRVFHERAKRLIADMEEAELAVSRAQGELKGTLRVSAPLTFGLRHLAPVILQFAEANSGVEFDLDFNDREVDLVHEGFDLAIRVGKLADSTLVARRLASVRLVLCASPDYVARQGMPETPSDLEGHESIAYSLVPEPGVWRYQGPDGGSGVVKTRSRMSANNGDFLLAAAVAGQGLLLSPDFICHRELETGRLVELLPDYSWSDIALYAVYPRTRHLSVRVRALVDFLVESFGGTPWWSRVAEYGATQ